MRTGLAALLLTAAALALPAAASAQDNPDVSLAGGYDLRMDGLASGDETGMAVAGAGDVNGDGLGDVIVGAAQADVAGTNSGAAYIVYGGTTPGNLSLAALEALEPEKGRRIMGKAGERAGYGVSAAGDVNGDGVDDVLVGAPYASNLLSGSGSAYVVYGQDAADPADVDLAAMLAPDFQRVDGAAAGDFTGRGVSAAGDFNDDGIDDFAVGAESADSNGANSGAAFVVYGQDAADPSDVQLAVSDGRFTRVNGAAGSDGAGWSLAAAGDFNGDEIDDLAIGAPLGASATGAAYVVYGSADADPADLSLATDPARAVGFGGYTNSRAGWDVGGAGDFNGDGVDDVLVGAIGFAGQSGSAFVVYGEDTADPADLPLAAGAARLMRIDGGASDLTGIAVNGLGDVNDDGSDDTAVASLQRLDAAGTTDVIYGTTDADPADINLNAADTGRRFTITGAAPNAYTSIDVGGRIDFDGDGANDIAIGAPFETGPGRAYVVGGTTYADPAATDDEFTVDEDSNSANHDVLGNDTDEDGGEREITAVGDPDHGAASVVEGSPDEIAYEPDDDYCNTEGDDPTDDFDYTLNGGDTGTVAVTVTCVGDDPVAEDDEATVAEDSGETPVAVLANDTDVDATGEFVITSAQEPANGSVVVAGDGSGLTYEPDADYCNSVGGAPTDDFIYTLAGGDTANVAMTVTCSGDDPVADDDDRIVDEDAGPTNLDPTSNDEDVDGENVEITEIEQPEHGEAVLLDGSPDEISYQPDTDYCNTEGDDPDDEIVYTVAGGDTATIAIEVTCSPDDPTALDDTASPDEDSPPTAIDVLANDTDPDATDDITIVSATDPPNGEVVLTGGTDGARTGLTYEPDDDYCNIGGTSIPDSFDYTINGGDVGTVEVTVNCIDDAPVAENDDETVAEDAEPTEFEVLTNDSDAESDAIEITDIDNPANGTASLVDGSSDKISYEPDADYCNDPGADPTDDFDYTVNGGDTATVAVTVTCEADDPVAVDDTQTVAEDADATPIDVLANDTDADETRDVELASVDNPANGDAVIEDGKVSYTPDADYCNDPGTEPTDDFDYTLNGGDTGTVAVTVTCSGDDPVAVDDAETVGEDSGPTDFDVRANDTDADAVDDISLMDVDNPSNGTASIEAGKIRYTPDDDYCNDPGAEPTDDFDYTLNGGDEGTVSVTVTCVGDAPVAGDDPETAAEDAAATDFEVLDNDTDADAVDEISLTAVDKPSNGTASIEGDKVRYTPDGDYCNDPGAAPTDDFDYTLNGGDKGTISVTVTCVGDAPVAVDDSRTVGEDSGATDFDVLANDTDADAVDDISLTDVGDPSDGTTSIVAGKVRYTPDADYCNSGEVILDDFDYTVNGGDTATVSVSVTCAAEARADSATVAEDSGATEIDVEDNDDDNGLEYHVTSVSNPAHGSASVVQGDPDRVAYTPDADYCNDPGADPTDDFTYTITGGATATVAITVTCVADDSNAVDDARTVAEGSGDTSFDVLANDTDADGELEQIASVRQPPNGTVAVTGGGASLTYRPDLGYCNSQAGGNPDSFTYTLDGGSQATVAVKVTCAAKAPTAGPAPAKCAGLAATIEVKPGGGLTSGTAGRDVIVGTTGDDRIQGMGGDDVICAAGGSDRVHGNGGDDQLLGGSGKDRIWGDSGNDRLRGDSGADRLAGGSGKDFVQGYGGNDRISGNSGDDRLSGSSGNDRISGGTGRDRIWGRTGRDRIFARDGGRDRVNCGSGADVASLDASDRDSGC